MGELDLEATREPYMTPRQARFVEAYLGGASGADAFRSAGYHAPPDKMGKAVYRLMHSRGVAHAIERALAARRERVEVKVDIVLSELVALLRSDVAGLFAEDGTMLPIHQVDPALRRAVAGVETHELWERHAGERVQVGVVRKVKLWDKAKAVELALRHLGLLRDRTEVDLGPSLVDAVKAATERRHARLALVAGGAPSSSAGGAPPPTPGFAGGPNPTRTPSDGST